MNKKHWGKMSEEELTEYMDEMIDEAVNEGWDSFKQ